jgi:hypothetical protein
MVHSFSPPDSHTLFLNNGRDVTQADQLSRPSLIHRIVSSSIIQFCLVLQFLSPYIKFLVCNLMQSERMHKTTESVATASMNTASTLCKSCVFFASTVMKFGDGKMSKAILSLAMWWLTAVVGGIYEGVGEGLVILCDERQKSKMAI